MRALGLVLALLACAGALLFAWARARDDARGVRAEQSALTMTTEVSAGADPRVAALERRIDELALDLSALRDELARTREPRRAPAAEESTPRSPAATDGNDDRSPAWYLAQYVASFAGGGHGSEYFRLAVEAFAPSLLREIGALVLDPRAHAVLRRRLVEMLGDARFRGNGAALELCLELTSARGADAVVEAALTSLQRIGDPRTARALEGLYWSIELVANRLKAVQTMVTLSGSDANAVLARLWPRALDDVDRGCLIGLVRPNEGEESLALFEQAARASQPVRLKAALAVRRFRFPRFPAFVDGWRAREPDEQVRAALGTAQKDLDRAPDWSAERAIGPPDAHATSDDPNAWASAQGDMGLQWLELGYDPPLRASAVRVFEVCVPGALASLVALDEQGSRHELWAGVDPTGAPGVLELAFPATSFRVRALLLTLDTNRRAGWSEIDAVELVGPDGRAWAASARASSSYGR